MKNSKPTVCIIVNGCPENRNDGARIQNFLVENGYQVISDHHEADIVLFRPCGGFDHFEKEAVGIIETLKQTMKPNARLIVSGCLSRINPTAFREVHDGLIFGAEDFDWLDDKFMDTVSIQQVIANHLAPFTSLKNISGEATQQAARELGLYPRILRGLRPLVQTEPFRSLNDLRKSIKIQMNRNGHKAAPKPSTSLYNSDAYYIKISTGCNHACSYCAIRISRGRLKSKPFQGVLEEFENGVRQGHKKIILIGTEISSYGEDLGSNLAEFLREIIKIDGDYKIGLRNVHPRFLIDSYPELKRIFDTGKIYFIYCAIQSGNNRILKLMKRDYRAEEIEGVFDAIKNEYPGLSVGTQLIIGFPTETEEEFQDTRRFVERSGVDLFECYKYNPRLGTLAAKLEGRVPEEIINKRYWELQQTIRHRGSPK